MGDAYAHVKLGVMYYNGWGVPQDFITAHMWYSLAASKGNDLAAEDRDIIPSIMFPAEIERAQARAAQCLASKCQDCVG